MISIVLGSIFTILSGLHLYWTLGGRWGMDKALPSKADGTIVLQPGVLSTLIVALGLGLFASIYLDKAALINLSIPGNIKYHALWVMPTIFILRGIGDFRYCGLFRQVKGTTFAKYDASIFTPLCFLIGVLGYLEFYL